MHNLINDACIASLDPEILDLCDELESLGGGINTRIEPIKAHIINNQDQINHHIFQKSLRNHYNSSFIIFENKVSNSDTKSQATIEKFENQSDGSIENVESHKMAESVIQCILWKA